MDKLIDPQRKPDLLDKLRREADLEVGRSTQAASPSTQHATRSSVQPSPIPHPQKWGIRVVKEMPLEMVFKHLSINELYRLSWGAKNTHGDEWTKLKSEFDARLERMTKEALRDREAWLKPQAVYGYFPCQSDGNDLIIA
jgi:5-methyltetrahydrofolate--homocysteine methyltransferase